MNFRKCIAISVVIHAGLVAFAHTFEVPDVDDYLIFEEATRSVSIESIEAPVHFEHPAVPAEPAGSVEASDDDQQEVAEQQSAEQEPAEQEPAELAQAPEPQPSEVPDPSDEPDPIEEPDDVDEPEIAQNHEADEAVVEDAPQADSDAAKELAEADTKRPAAETGGGDAQKSAGPASADNTAGGSSSGAASNKTAQAGAPSTGGGADIDRAQVARGYGHSVRRLLDRNKQYPRLAQRAGVQGTVTVRILIDARGNILEVEVVKSSGHEVLDRAAIDSVRSLGKLPAPPAVLAWNRKPLQLPISYRLS